MKKVLFLLLFTISIGFAVHAQEDKDKVKKTSTLGQKIHNTFSSHKKHNGYKTKHEHNGVMHKHKVKTKTGEQKNKIKD